MSKSTVAIVKYQTPLDSVRQVLELCGGLKSVTAKTRVYIKPNVVFWTTAGPFPKWGAITTSRVVHDVVVLLKELGVEDITIGEGIVTSKYKDKNTPAHAFESLGYRKLEKRYGVKVYNTFEREFEEVDLGDGLTLNFNSDILHSDFVVDIPVMKTHAQATVSLGLKNLKGMLDIESRKRCHSADVVQNLDFCIARFADKLPPVLNLIDGIYSLERGPGFDGKAKRFNVLVASADILSADLVGAKILGFDPAVIPHLVHATKARHRPLDLSDIEVVGEKIDAVAQPHEAFFKYNEDGSLPLPMEKLGIKGIHYYKYDDTMCTYCSGLNPIIITAIAMAWKGQPWDEVEVLTGKRMKPKPGMNKTILLGKCMTDAHQDNPDLKEAILVKGCPPVPQTIVKALHKAGIEVDPAIFENLEAAPMSFMKRYKDKPEYEESFYTVT